MSQAPQDQEGGHAPELGMHVTWVFKLSKRDSLLVLKALGGRLSEDEVAEAKALGDRLTVLRANDATQYQQALVRAAMDANPSWLPPKSPYKVRAIPTAGG